MNCIKRYFEEKFLRWKIFKLRISLIFQRIGKYKSYYVDVIERSTNSNLKTKSVSSIKSIFIVGMAFLVIGAGTVFAQTQNTTLDQCAPSGGSGLAVWNSCGFTPSIFQSMSISILGNYTQLNSSTTSDNTNYTGGYGALGDISSLMGTMYSTPPASGVGYFAYLGKNAGFINPTYAASSSTDLNSGPVYGFSFLSPIESLWAFTRDLAYILLIIIIIFTGLMIIIGGKIGGQVPITFMSALPNIIAAIILIEFSYAIGGFMIDFMNVLLGFVYYAFTNSPMASTLGSGSFYSAFSSRAFVFNVFGHIMNVSGLQNLGSTVTNQLNLKNYGILGHLVNAVAGFAGNSSGGDSLIIFIISVILLFTALRIFISLVGAYISLVFLPVAAPFMFLFGAFPGQTKTIWSFFSGMLKAILTFVLVYVMFLIIYYLTHGNSGSAVQFGTGNLPILGIDNIGSVVGAILAIGLFVLIPKLISDITKFLGQDFGGYTTEFQKNFQGPISSLQRLYGNVKKSTSGGH